MIALNKTIRLFLDSIGRRDEYEFYLNKFQSEPTACFALLCPDPGSIEAGAEVLAFDLHFLLRLELVPAILLCGEQAATMRESLSVEAIFRFHALEDGDVKTFIQAARADEKVPVLVEEKADLETVLLQLVPDVARRVHFVRAAGGLQNAAGELMPYIYTERENTAPVEDLVFDYPALGKRLLKERPGLHLSVTSPIRLLEEIFTVKGAGTLFRKGSMIRCFTGVAEVDRVRLLQLLESSFGRKLSNEDFLSNVGEAYIEQQYRGAVLLEKHPAGFYLSKFAVGREARGEGLALELWREVSESHRALFWRSHVANPFNSWYHQRADGHHREGRWQIFWRGVSPEAISDIITYCSTRDEDFEPPTD
jgi:hypothetical protein